LTAHDARLVFGFGANDCYLIDGQKRVQRPESEKNAREILTKARDLLPTLMIGPPPGVDGEQHALRTDMSVFLKGIAADVGVPYLDVIAGMGDGEIWRNESLAGDKIHPGAQGYATLAQLVLAWRDWWF
jgi:lysophospholipase L1-like esterase